MIRAATGICLILAVGLIVVLADQSADGCAMVRPIAYRAPIEVAEESAIIIWDEATKTEHFIRRANFKTEAKDFGFLVPTPTRPELAEAKDSAFKFLERLTAPRILLPPRGGGNFKGKAPAENAPVEVLEVKRVAGFVAAVLKADDASALNDWLKQNGYQSSPELVSWLEPYVKSKWIITAFKIASDAPNSKGINTSAVRMSFKKDKPFYPYREPSDQRGDKEQPKVQPVNGAGRLLRVYVLAKERMQANLGDKQWPGKTVFANKISEANCKTLAKNLKLENWQHAGEWWLTELEDRSFPRPGTDELYLARSADQATVTRPIAVGLPRPPVPAPAPKVDQTKKLEPAQPR